MHSGSQLHRQRDLLLGGGIDDLLCFCKTEPVTEGKDAAIENGEQKIPPGLISLAKQGNQGQGDHVDDIDGDHGAHGAGGIDLCPLLDVLCQRAAQGTAGNIDAGVPQDQNAVGNVHIYGFGRVRPGGMGPKRQHQHKGRQGRAEKKPGTVAAPATLSAVTERTDQRVIDGIPKPGDQHQGGNGGHRDAAHIRVKDHQKIANKHPAEVAAYIAKAIRQLAEERNFDIGFLAGLHVSTPFRCEPRPLQCWPYLQHFGPWRFGYHQNQRYWSQCP